MRLIPALLLTALFPIMLQAAETGGDLTRGLEIAKENCGACHALGTKGASPNPKSPPFREIPHRFPVEYLEEALAEGINVGHGGPEMPEFEFAPEEIDDLLAYMRDVSKRTKRLPSKTR